MRKVIAWLLFYTKPKCATCFWFSDNRNNSSYFRSKGYLYWVRFLNETHSDCKYNAPVAKKMSECIRPRVFAFDICSNYKRCTWMQPFDSEEMDKERLMHNG